jgi:chromosome segregation ATPase
LAAKDAVLLELNNTLDATESRLKKTSAELKKTSAELDTTKTTLGSTKLELDTTQATLADLKTQHQKALADLAFNDNQRKTLATNLAETTKSLNACVVKNEQLYAYGKSLVDLYDTPSRYEAAMRKEKFLQLKRVELENILQDKLDRLDEARVGNKGMIRP